MADAVLEAMAMVGAGLVLLAGIGVLRLRDVYARMHSATKASTVGIGLIGIAAAFLVPDDNAKVLAAIAFIFFTAPSAAHFVGRAAYRAEGIEVDLRTRDDLASIVDDGAEPDDA